MREVVEILIGVGSAVGVTVGLFVVANLLLDQATARYVLFRALAGALLGAVVGAAVNSGGWFLGGSLWPAGGAVLGAVGGGLLGRRRIPSLADRRRTMERWRPVVFLAPAFAFLVVALVAPTLRTIYLSLRSRRGEDFVGLDNFESVFRDPSIFTLDNAGDILTSRLFLLGLALGVGVLAITVIRARVQQRDVDLTGPGPALSVTAAAFLVVLAGVGSLRSVLWNNLYWVLLVTFVSTAAGLGIAVLADRARGESVAKSFIFMPMAISFVGASVIWRFVYAYTPAGRDQIGLLNALWVGGGGEPQAWIQQAPWNTLFLIAIMIWIQTGFAMVVLSAAIKAVPAELLEAARVDGANDAQVFWRITIPQIRTTIAVVVTTLVITVLKVYDIVKVMTNGEFGTNVLANQMFDESFINRDLGRGSTLA
ncbi:MAG: sugar ABC transporter permease, partial [Actinomycetota bacterium]|nr:sugar ABC transporter permease [Actinomycetota bacterium]